MNKARDILKTKHYPRNGWPDGLQDFGFHYSDNIDMVINAAKVLEFYGEWPSDGGYFEQDANLVADMLRWTSLERYIERTEFSKDTS